MTSKFDFPSFIIGLLLGMIVMLILIWISYFTRTGAFVNCPTVTPACAGDDYYNNPGEAIANAGVTAGQILFIEDGQMYYKRVPKISTCVPEGNQVVRIAYPQYCEFSGLGISGTTGRDLFFNANMYETNNIPPIGTIRTDENCVPQDGQSVDTGTPILEWDPSHLAIAR